MLDESRSAHSGKSVRQLREPEIALLRALVLKARDQDKFLNQLASLGVQEMSDGGMGGLYLLSPAKTQDQRRFGRRIADLQFNDADGVAILASLNVDQDGDLYELDVWKTDFTPVRQLAPPKLPGTG